MSLTSKKALLFVSGRNSIPDKYKEYWEKEEFLPFKEARAFVHKLKLKSKNEWKAYSKSGKRPEDIPANPRDTYGKEFLGWGDWLGTGTIASFNKVYLSFKQARSFVQKLKLKSFKEWSTYSKSGKRPEDIPANPYGVYGGEFLGMGDWLGTGTIAYQNRAYLPFKQARSFVQKLKLKSQTEWKTYSKSGKKPEDIPADPYKTYGKEFLGWGDWLGTGTIAYQNRVYLPYKQARAFVQKLKLKSRTEWKTYSKSGKKPENIPANPLQTYGEEFLRWGDWLGTGTIASFNKVYLSFKQARSFVQKLKLKSQTEWKTYSKSGKKPEDIPANPYKTYGKEFKGMGDWLGTGTIAPQNRVYLPYKQARAFVHKLKLKSHKEWLSYIKSGKKPEAIPSGPYGVYGKEFLGFGDWLGTGTIAYQNRVYLPFKQARAFVQKLKLKSRTEWETYSKSGKKPENIPANPRDTYGEEFLRWGDWLGSGNLSPTDKSNLFLPYKQARSFVQKLKLKSRTEWLSYIKSGKKPEDIPANPYGVYGKEFKGMGDWLGTGTIAYQNRVYLPYKQARAFVHKLKLKSRTEWETYSKSGKKPEDIPADPYGVYGKEFLGFGDWLGKGNKK